MSAFKILIPDRAEKSSNHGGDVALTAHTNAETVIAEAAAVAGSDEIQHFLSPVGIGFSKPVREDRGYGAVEPDHGVGGIRGAVLCRRFDERRDFGIVQARNDRGNHGSYGNPRLG